MRKCACCNKEIYQFIGRDYVYRITKNGKTKVYCGYECFKQAGGSLEKEVKFGKGKDSYPREGDTPGKLVRLR